MNSDKKLDRLFQEKLKGLEVTPPDIVWENIEAQLDDKRKKRILPFWFKNISAAVILLSITLGGFYYFNNSPEINPTKNTITNTLIDTIPKIKNAPILISTPIPAENNESVVISTNKNSNDQKVVPKKIQNEELVLSSKKQKEIIESRINNSTIKKTDFITPISLTNRTESYAISDSNNNSKKINLKFNQSKTFPLFTIQNNLTFEDKFEINLSQYSNDKKANSNWTVTSTNTKPPISKIDSLDTNTLAIETSLNNSLDETEELIEKTPIEKKWSVASVIAPVYYNSFNSKGSPLDQQFENNPKEGSNSISYGVKFAYQFNKKISLQSGIAMMNIGFTVNDVYMNPIGKNSIKLSNVNYVSTAKVIGVNALIESNNTLLSETSINEPLKGSLSQDFGYIEVPLELKYNIIQGKFKTHIVAGFSTLILNNNNVYIENIEFSSNLGEANNLNNLNFSANFGLDFDYSINHKLFINAAPMLKIYTNTFSKNAENFEPYIIGFYTGLNYRF